MKTPIYIILLFIFSIVSCKAQSPIISIYDDLKVPRQENAYYKDTDNDFDRFIGTWKYTNGQEELTIIINKKLSDYHTNYKNISYYEDIIYGEFQYIDSNGVELVNTLSNIDNTTIGVSQHQIFGNRINPSQFLPGCENCGPNERSVFLSFRDPLRDYIKCELVLRTIPNTQNSNVNDLKAVITGSYSIIPEGSPTDSRIPYGKYVMIKQ
ncbi:MULTISPECIES: DUF6705 family protein [Bizionia]|uniref:DUF6705 domain-containing protein n=1 Tax=Bizionia algoritergicola TaxID=291187 RepID=A0A5D0R1D8_9FLAO|nr:MULTISPECIES: DUF6705 family protein [Bizionia]OBX23569.1 hypothetical protein BAA08_04250 [Bizionia sp. APA-3]TYB74899.1 hypothetical protein ES675_01815 [Bizionia algoritergicola]